MRTIHVWPRRLKEFLLTHPLYKSPSLFIRLQRLVSVAAGVVGGLGGVVGDDDGGETKRVNRGGLSFSSRRLE